MIIKAPFAIALATSKTPFLSILLVPRRKIRRNLVYNPHASALKLSQMLI